jgi:hypothetical protein
MVSKNLYIDSQEKNQLEIKNIKNFDKTFELLSLEKSQSLEHSLHHKKFQENNLNILNDPCTYDLKPTNEPNIVNESNPSPNHPLLTFTEGFNKFNKYHKYKPAQMYNNFVLNEDPSLIPKTSSDFFRNKKLKSTSFDTFEPRNNPHSILSINSNRKLLKAFEETDRIDRSGNNFKYINKNSPIKIQDNFLNDPEEFSVPLSKKNIHKNRVLSNYKNIIGNETTLLTFNSYPTDLNLFLNFPVPINYTLECNLVVDHKDDSFYLFINQNNLLLLTADKFRKKSQNIFLQDKDCLIANLNSNFWGTDFTITHDKIKKNLCSIRFEYNLFGLKKPRKVDLFIPKLNDETGYMINTKDEFV